MEDDLKPNQIEDGLNLLILEDDLKQKSKNQRWPKNKWKIKPILTNSTAQYRKPDQHNNQKYIDT